MCSTGSEFTIGRNRYWSASITRKKQSNGSDRLGLATSAFRLATVYRMQGDFKGAEPYFRESLAIRQQTLGPDAAPVLEVLDGLGSACTTRAAMPKLSRSCDSAWE